MSQQLTQPHTHIPTPYASVIEMLTLAKAGPKDVLVDLGSGDGTITNLAALIFKVRKAYGIELHKPEVDKAREMAKELFLGDRVEFICGDMFELDLERFDVITIFQSQEAIERLLTKLMSEPVSGTRIVSYLLPLGGLSPLRLVRPSKVSHPFYLYEAPLEYLDAEASATLLGEISKFAEGSEKEWARVSSSIGRSDWLSPSGT